MGYWFWESSAGEPVYLGYSWVRNPAVGTHDPSLPNSLEVYGVFVGSPIYKAGLTAGSGGLSELRIQSIDGKAMTNAVELAAYLEDKTPGDTVSLNVGGEVYLVELESPPPKGTEAELRFVEQQEDQSVLVALVDTVADVPAAIIEETGKAASSVLDAGADVVDAQAELVSSAAGGLVVLGLLAAGGYFIYNRELGRMGG
jgi:hypothetical protein